MLLRALAAGLLALSAGQTGDRAATPARPAQQPAVIRYFPAPANGAAQLDAALARARTSGKSAVIVFGADWCHDSRALGEVLTSGAFTRVFGNRFDVTFIDVGKPQTGAGRNLELVKQLGVDNLKSTPALFVVSPQGKLLNGTKDAVSWRNADSRGPARIIAWFRGVDQR